MSNISIDVMSINELTCISILNDYGDLEEQVGGWAKGAIENN